jgi:hypothetical protein
VASPSVELDPAPTRDAEGCESGSEQSARSACTSGTTSRPTAQTSAGGSGLPLLDEMIAKRRAARQNRQDVTPSQPVLGDRPVQVLLANLAALRERGETQQPV